MLVLASVVAATLSAAPPVAAAQTPTPDCHEPEACRELALEARARGAFEIFHDLAWRAVQTGRPNDPDLMYLLARAQALSGRRRDALIMLRRLAEAGVVNDAAIEPDLRRVRELPGWREVAALAARLTASAPSAAPADDPVPPPPAAPEVIAPPAAPPEGSPAHVPIPPMPPVTAPAPRSALRVEPAAVEDAARFSTRPFVASGLAYDAVSHRFLFGDMAGRRLFVVGERTARTTDLVRGESAGFEEVTALASDADRGDLWVASSAASRESGAIHRLQLVSGRLLATYPAPTGTRGVRLVDLAVSRSGVIGALDAAAPQVLVLRPRATTFEAPVPLAVAAPVSLAVDDPGRSAYVAHAGGILRVDLQARTAAPLTAEDGLDLANVERLRWYGSALIAVQRQPDGSRGVVRLEMNRAGTRAIGAALLHVLPDGDISFPAIAGDALYYLAAPPPDRMDEAAPRTTDVIVRRMRLR